jgi:hypothetical protein
MRHGRPARLAVKRAVVVRLDPAHQAVRNVGGIAFRAAAFAQVARGVDGAAVVHSRGAVVLCCAGACCFAVAVFGESQRLEEKAGIHLFLVSVRGGKLTLASDRRRDLCLSSHRGSSV